MLHGGGKSWNFDKYHITLREASQLCSWKSFRHTAAKAAAWAANATLVHFLCSPKIQSCCPRMSDVHSCCCNAYTHDGRGYRFSFYSGNSGAFHRPFAWQSAVCKNRHLRRGFFGARLWSTHVQLTVQPRKDLAGHYLSPARLERM